MALGWINTECCLQLSEEKFCPNQISVNCEDGKKTLATTQCLKNLPSRHPFLRSYHKNKEVNKERKKNKFAGLREHDVCIAKK